MPRPLFFLRRARSNPHPPRPPLPLPSRPQAARPAAPHLATATPPPPRPLRPAARCTPCPPPRAHDATPTGHLGLYTPSEGDKDACGVGFVAELNRAPTRACVTDALEALDRMAHRGACGCEANTGA